MAVEGREVRAAVVSFAAFMAEFDLPPTSENFRRWAAADPTVPALGTVLIEFGSWQRALDFATAADVAAAAPEAEPEEVQPDPEAWGQQWGAAAIALAEARHRPADIARDLGQPLEQVQAFIDANGLPTGSLADARQAAWNEKWGPTARERAEAGRTQAQIADDLGEPLAKVRAFLLANGIKTIGQGNRPRPNAERNREIVARWVNGLTLAEAGAPYGLTRERVRQLVAKAGAQRSVTPADLRHQARKQRHTDVAERWGSRIRLLASQCTSVAAIHAHLPDVTTAEISAYMQTNGIRCRGDRPSSRLWSDEDILDSLRTAAEDLELLTAGTYQVWSKEYGAPGPQTVMNGFGSWSAGLQRAGLEPVLGPTRTYRNNWTTQRCIEAVRGWLETAETPTFRYYEQDLRAGADLPSRAALARQVGTWNMAVRCAETWQKVLDSGAMTVDDADLEPHQLTSAGYPRLEVTKDMVRPDVTQFIEQCRTDGVHPSAIRYEKWARSDPDAHSYDRVTEAYGGWNAALVDSGFTAVKRSPNPKVT